MTPDAERLRAIAEGGKRAVAAALSAIETAARDTGTIALLDAAGRAPKGRSIGLTGPPGVGKSTLTDALVRHFREQGHTVGVIAIDPSSTRTGGALLGDRTRIVTDPGDKGVFIRSFATRGRLGGLSDLTYPSVVLLRALYDRVIVESVGVGQSEADIAGVADTVVLCVQPGSGDSLQFMKAGIMEIPDIAVVTKADLGAVAERALSELAGALSLSSATDGAPLGADAVWRVPTLKVASITGNGIRELGDLIDAHWDWLEAEAPGGVAGLRARQADGWIARTVEQQFGVRGRAAIGEKLAVQDGEGVFSAAQRVAAELDGRLGITPGI